MEGLALVINQPDEGKFLTQIGWNKEEIIDGVQKIIEQYEGLTYTEEDMKTAKKDRAELNSLRSAIDGRRKEVKNALLEPYSKFEQEVKEVLAIIDKPIALIDQQTSAYEERLKEEKKNELIEFFKENVGDLKEVLTFETLFNPKWLNKTMTMKSCKEEIQSEIQRTNTDMNFIDQMVAEKYQNYSKDTYFRQGRNMTSVLKEVARMKEIDRKAEEERIAREEAEERRREAEAEEKARPQEQIRQETLQEPIETVEPETVIESSETRETSESVIPKNNFSQHREKIYKASFTVKGTKEQILAVKQFMIKNNIEFGKVGE